MAGKFGLFISSRVFVFAADGTEGRVGHCFTDRYAAEKSDLLQLFVRADLLNTLGQTNVLFPLCFPLNEKIFQARLEMQVFQEIFIAKVLKDKKEKKMATRGMSEDLIQLRLPFTCFETRSFPMQFEKINEA